MFNNIKYLALGFIVVISSVFVFLVLCKVLAYFMGQDSIFLGFLGLMALLVLTPMAFFIGNMLFNKDF